MRKILTLTAFILTNYAINAQEIYFKAGKNNTKFIFVKNSGGNVFNSPPRGIGDVAEIGYSLPFYKIFTYSLGLTLNQYNAAVGTPSVNVKWNTEYVGIQNGLLISLIKTKNFGLGVNLNSNVSTIYYGNLELNLIQNDLKKSADFNGIMIASSLGIQGKVKVVKNAFLTLEYNASKSFQTKSISKDSFSFHNNQFLIGLHITNN